MLYWTKTHWFLKRLLPGLVWDVKTREKIVYLTFDDGPIPEATPWVLQQLQQYGARATFFCIGNNIAANPEIYNEIVRNHAVGNHTYNHVNGWKASPADYLDEVDKCSAVMKKTGAESMLFRPPYGKIKWAVARALKRQGYKIIMWDVLSGDFDHNIAPERCLQHVISNITPGSIIIFHDSVKAFKNLEYALPRTLKFLKDQGYACEVLT